MDSDLDSQLTKLFFSYAKEKQEEVQKNNTRFVHYTSAESAIKIIKNQEVWMRNALCMNDFSEVKYGLDCLYKPYKEILEPYLETKFPGTIQEFNDTLNTWTPEFLYQTYLTCVSEHSELENETGRLSMWRTFGKTTGVAIILNTAPFFSESNALNVWNSPVAYLDSSEFFEKINEITEKMKSSNELLYAAGEDKVKFCLFLALKFAILSTKHQGFKEEREWRLIFSPSEEDSRLKFDIELIDGVPQKVYKLPLKDFSNEGLYGTTIPELVDRIIIGPTQYPWPIKDAFIETLRNSGVNKPSEKVVVSDIPIRR